VVIRRLEFLNTESRRPICTRFSIFVPNLPNERYSRGTILKMVPSAIDFVTFSFFFSAYPSSKRSLYESRLNLENSVQLCRCLCTYEHSHIEAILHGPWFCYNIYLRALKLLSTVAVVAMRNASIYRLWSGSACPILHRMCLLILPLPLETWH